MTRGKYTLSDEEFRVRYPSLFAAWEWEGRPRNIGWDGLRLLRFDLMREQTNDFIATFEDFLRYSCPEVG